MDPIQTIYLHSYKVTYLKDFFILRDYRNNFLRDYRNNFETDFTNWYYTKNIFCTPTLIKSTLDWRCTRSQAIQAAAAAVAAAIAVAVSV